VATLLLSRAVQAESVAMFTPKAITVLRSDLDQKCLRRAVRILAPEGMDLRSDWYRGGHYGKGVNWRELGEDGRRKVKEGEFSRMVSAPEPMIFSSDLTGLQEALLPDYPRETLTLGPVDEEILRLVMGFEYPELEEDLVEDSLAALALSEAKAEIRPFDLICACRAPEGEGAFCYLEKCLERSAADKSATAAATVAKAVAPLSDLVGYGEAKPLALDLVAALNDWDKGDIEWSDVPRGLLLVGAPGTGKTELARSIAGDADVSFVSASYAEWQKQGHLGDFLKAMSESFEDARGQSPCVLFLDELDSFAQSQGGGHNATYDLKAMKGLLEQLDGINGREGVAIVAAANSLEDIPPVLRRSGRFDSVVTIGLPTLDDLEVILTQHLQKGESAVDAATCAVHALGQTGADCAAALRRARTVARRARSVVTTESVIEELNGGFRGMSADLQSRIAVHECGHALVASTYPEMTVDFLCVSAAGGRCQTSGGDRVHTSATMHSDRAILLGGRAAEVLVFGEASSGAGGDEVSDLAKATISAANEIGAYGLGHSGAVWLAPDNSGQLLREAIDGNLHEISDLIVVAEHEAAAHLADKVPQMRQMADALLETGVLAGERLQQLLLCD